MNNSGMGPAGQMLGNPRQQNNPNQLRRGEKMDGKTKRRVLLRLGKYLFRYKWLLLLGLVLMLSSNVLGLIGPKLSGEAIDLIEAGYRPVSAGGSQIDFAALTPVILQMALCYVGAGLLSFALALVLVLLGKKITYSLRKDLFNHLLTLPVGYYDTHATGDIISHISYDVDTVNTSLSHDLLQICASIVTVVGSLYLMVTISPLLLGVFVLTVPLTLYMTKKRTTKVRPLFRLRSAKLGELNGYAEEMLSGQKTIRAYGRQKTVNGRFAARNREACDAYYNADWHGAAIGPSVNFINNLALSLIIMFGGIFYLYSLGGVIAASSVLYIELGDLSAFVQYSRKFSGPVNEFANILADLQSALSAAERIFHILDEAPEAPDAPDATVVENAEGTVRFDHVKFGYVPGKTIIQDLSVDVNKGQTIAIVGPTGAGKTTIINLLMRFYDIDSGTIRLDGHPIQNVTRASLRASFTMVLQDTWLFGGTVAQNIAYGREGATMDEIVAAAKAAKIDSFIRTLPQGYDTVMTDNGVSISKGQKQLITIARAMLSHSPMLILDEATSNVDSRTEQQIQEAMRKLMQGRTCFVIAHRLSTIQNADKILVVQKGNVTEQGTHAELMRAGGFYATLYNSQFS